MRYFTIVIFSLTGLCSCSSGQNFKEQFNELLTKQDTVAQQKLLDKWKSSKPNDPELYVAFYNFYVRKSKMDVLTIDNKPKTDDALQIMDKDSTITDPVGFINSGNFYKPDLLKLAYSNIDEGIAKFPKRLDMRFGKIYMLGETMDYENFTKEIIAAIDYSPTIKDQWLWSNNEPVKDPKTFMLGSIQNYVVQLYNAGDAQADNMKKIAETVLRHYPDHVESLSNLSIVYTLKGDLDNSLAALLKAEKIAPKDYIVLGNIAHCYNQKGDKQNAIKYYELTAKYGDEQTREFANQQLSELKK